MNATLINAAGLVLIGLIVWWFWLSRPAARRADAAPITVVVEDGVYSPARIEVAPDRPVAYLVKCAQSKIAEYSKN